jgi:hypothetical protein
MYSSMLVCYNNKTPSYDLTYSKKVIIYKKKRNDILAHFRNYLYLCTRKNDKRSYLLQKT